jgi:hypothetical protein
VLPIKVSRSRFPILDGKIKHHKRLDPFPSDYHFRVIFLECFEELSTNLNAITLSVNAIYSSFSSQITEKMQQTLGLLEVGCFFWDLSIHSIVDSTRNRICQIFSFTPPPLIQPFLASNREIFLEFKVDFAVHVFNSCKQALLELLLMDEVGTADVEWKR